MRKKCLITMAAMVVALAGCGANAAQNNDLENAAQETESKTSDAGETSGGKAGDDRCDLFKRQAGGGGA